MGMRSSKVMTKALRVGLHQPVPSLSRQSPPDVSSAGGGAPLLLHPVWERQPAHAGKGDLDSVYSACICRRRGLIPQNCAAGMRIGCYVNSLSASSGTCTMSTSLVALRTTSAGTEPSS